MSYVLRALLEYWPLEPLSPEPPSLLEPPPYTTDGEPDEELDAVAVGDEVPEDAEEDAPLLVALLTNGFREFPPVALVRSTGNAS